MEWEGEVAGKGSGMRDGVGGGGGGERVRDERRSGRGRWREECPG